MKFGLRLRGGLLATLIMFGAPVLAPVGAAFVSSSALAQTVQSISVEGNRRVEVETIRSYFKPGPGGRLDQGAIDDGLKALIETGLFQDVRINRGAGGQIVVSVVENPVIGRIAFEGNKKIKDEQLTGEVQSKARGTFSRAMVQSDTLRIAEIYRRSGRYDVRVTPEIIEQPNNRVDLVFTVEEGAKTGVKSIEFVGNNAYSSYRLRDVIKTHESNLLSFLASSDIYDPDRVEADRDLIRRFYLKNGFADVQVVAALTEYDPEKKGFNVTFKIEEGSQYRVGSIDFRSSIPNFDPTSMRNYSRVNVGSLYNVESVEKSVEEMQIEASRRGYAFAVVRPGGDRNFEAHTVSVVFNIDEGPRTYIERINLRGNTRTRDYVIRREFDVSEGDAYNRALVDRAERRLKNLDYFKSVKITTEPGSSSDRVILLVDMEEKSTGDFSVSGGYSTTDGALAEVSVSERNLLGRGLFAKAAVTYGQYARGYSLSFVEPYLLDYRVALGLDLYQREQRSNSYISYGTKTLGFSPRLGFSLREDLSLQVRYSIYRQEITLPSYLANCNNNQFLADGVTPNPAFNPSPAFSAASGIPLAPSTNGLGCYSDGEASLPVRKELANGKTLTSALGYTLTYNTLDNNKNPTDGLLVDFRQDFAGVGGDVSYLKTVVDAKYYTPLVSDIVGLVRLQGGMLNKMGSDLRMLDHFQMGPNLVRGFAPNGIGPRDLNPFGTQDALGGTKYWGASLELQMPFWFLPKEVGLKGAVYADAGGLFDYQGPTTWSVTNELTTTKNSSCTPSTVNPASAGTCTGLVYDNGNAVRSSVGVGLIWASPFGPLRFDYAVPLTKGKNDRTQEFRFGGGTSF
ncbi:outer membrane protein insertion porin family [Bradyrhizobium sp. GM2.2]|jgi:outer membrane protein insertion porin family|uniref:Outer membrane protein assembly factor BamA n=1 Tax=Bradyrhizobium canariense TaxID=255045 RepID=A0A1X3FNL2_9BRAD|nr:MULTISPECIES: outer membrane protein assembly factor BamA [Bradyrhizobium]MCK1269877.1 outer membrane protein assembly factor BamA [Bradyrhizobium sp. 84]MCK1292297.1 outer membrane protein assembly factor BamA [Bradyrhizobium sp. 30]MCK1307010.1 outer membrane protein assembly factor BamA [Bradyrhizobium sp. 45]MCK1313789.1 outer membrane protein assembly factor BamA [Bradyrhizobium sp. 23]MCK1322730.1 outer membrane protein assembly factor BamA [Bradyrhizobium sp. 156]